MKDRREIDKWVILFIWVSSYSSTRWLLQKNNYLTSKHGKSDSLFRNNKIKDTDAQWQIGMSSASHTRTAAVQVSNPGKWKNIKLWKYRPKKVVRKDVFTKVTTYKNKIINEIQKLHTVVATQSVPRLFTLLFPKFSGKRGIFHPFPPAWVPSHHSLLKGLYVAKHVQLNIIFN